MHLASCNGFFDGQVRLATTLYHKSAQDGSRECNRSFTCQEQLALNSGNDCKLRYWLAGIGSQRMCNALC